MDLGRESPVEPRSPREEPGEQAGRPHFEALQYLTQATKGTYVKSGRKVPEGWEGQGRQDNSTDERSSERDTRAAKTDSL